MNAKLVEFGGWLMPVSYPSGTIEEHLACRHRAAMFDVSHLGTVRLSGASAFDRLQATLTNDLRKIGPGRAQYTHLLDAETAGVVDDIIVWWVGDDTFDVMPNASNTDRVIDALGGIDVTSTRCVVAVQGPNARRLAASVDPAFGEVGRFRVATVEWSGATLTVAGTGYTGEPGLEIAGPVEVAGALWDALAAVGCTPAGLAARDTLRLEAGLPLHGHELGPSITSLDADLGWVIGWDKPDFRGRSVLAAQRNAGVSHRLRGIATEGRRPPREGAAVLVAGSHVGTVTSGNFSPVLGHGIAMAFLPADLLDEQSVSIDVRGSLIEGTICPLPFVRSPKG